MMIKKNVLIVIASWLHECYYTHGWNPSMIHHQRYDQLDSMILENDKENNTLIPYVEMATGRPRLVKQSRTTGQENLSLLLHDSWVCAQTQYVDLNLAVSSHSLILDRLASS